MDKTDINFSTAVDMMNQIKTALYLHREPVPASDFCALFADDFNNAIKIKIAETFIEDPALFGIGLPNVLEEIVEKIGYGNYCTVKQFLKSEGIEIIDLKDVILKREYLI